MAIAPTNRRILLVDDQADILRSLKRYLAPRHAAILVAATPFEADEQLLTGRPDTLICDYWLGDGLPTGTELIARWRREHDFLRLAVLMTGTSFDVLSGKEHADHILEKPLDLARLNAILA